MKTVINEMLIGIAVKAVLIIAFSAAVLSSPVNAYAAGNVSTDSTKVYDSDYESWLHGNKIDIVEYHSFEYEGITYYVPSYRDDSNKKLLYSQYFVNKSNGYVFDQKIESLYLHPAILSLTTYGIYDSIQAYDYYNAQWPDAFKDVRITIAAPIVEVGGYQDSAQYKEELKDYYYYIATGAFPSDADRSRITLPDGWTLDEDGVPREYKSEVILKSSGTVVDSRNNSFPYEKSIEDYGDKRMCFYFESSDDAEIYYIYGDMTLDDYSESPSDRFEFLKTTSNFHYYNIIASGLNYGNELFILGNNCYTDRLFPKKEGSHGGGHFGTDSDGNIVNSLHGLLPVVRGYPVLINGFLDGSIVNKFISSFVRGEPRLLLKWLISLNWGSREVYPLSADLLGVDSDAAGDYIYSVLFNQTYYYPIKADTLVVTRPVFKKLVTATEWYESGFVASKKDIYYIPKGYYYHSDTCILDQNPLSFDEPAIDDDGISNVGWGNVGLTPISSSIKKTINKYEYHVSTGEGVTVIVTQENNNNQTNDNNQNVTVPSGNGNIEDSFPLNDIGDGLVWMGQLSSSLRSSSSSGSDNDSASSGAIDTDSWTDLLGGTFNFLPAAFNTLLLIGLIGAVLLRFLGR